MRHQVFCFRLTQALFYSTLNTNETRAELIFCQLAHATYTTVAEVIDIINLTAAVTQLNQNLDRFEDVLVRQCHGARNVVTTTQTAVHLHATYARQIVSIFAVEQALEECLNGIFSWRLTRTHHAIDRYARSHLIRCFICTQGLRNEWSTIEVVGVKRLDFADPCGAQCT